MSLQASRDSRLAPLLSYMANDGTTARPVPLLGTRARVEDKSRQKPLCSWAGIAASLYLWLYEPGQVISSPCGPQLLTC